MNTRRISAAFLLYFFIFSAIAYAEPSDKKRTSYFNEQWLKCVVSIEIAEHQNKATPIGTGFLVSSPYNHLLLLTAKHVILNDKGKVFDNLAYRLNDKSGKSILLPDIFCSNLGGGNWFLSKNSDVACRFILKAENSDIINIPIDIFLKSAELNVGAPLIILGFPMGLRSDEYAVPIARRAMVARSDPEFIIVDGFVFPGNSGGPVIYCPSIKFGKHITSGVLNEQRLIGLVSQSISYVDVAVSRQSKRPRIIFEDNSGLSKVIPSYAILELINRDDVAKFDEKFNLIK